MLATHCQGGAEHLPRLEVLGDEVRGCEGMYPRCGGGDDPDGTGEPQGGRRDLAPSRPPLVVAVGPKDLFERIIGPGQLWGIRTLEEAWPGTPRDFAAVRQRRGECPSAGLIPSQRAEQAAETAEHGSSGLL